jgi:hypothetical protein
VRVVQKQRGKTGVRKIGKRKNKNEGKSKKMKK